MARPGGILATIVTRVTLLVDTRLSDAYMRRMTNVVHKSNRFNDWLTALADEKARGAIAARIVRIEAGLMGDVKALGQGLSEMRVDVGPGYRVYMTQQGRQVIVLLCGGDKSSQVRDIKAARDMVSALEADKKKVKGKAAKKK